MHAHTSYYWWSPEAIIVDILFTDVLIKCFVIFCLQTLTNLQPNNLKDLFKKGQTVVTRLSKIDSEKKRFLGSLRLDECYEGGLKVPLSLLQNYLSARKHALEKLFSLGECWNLKYQQSVIF